MEKSNSAAPSAARRALARLGRLAALLFIALVVVRVSGCMERQFYYPERALTPVPAEPAGAEGVWFESRDGTRLFGWFIPARRHDAPGRAEGNAPTILHVHGNAGNIGSHLGFTEYLPAAGFNLFIFDYRGYGQSEGTARRRGPLIEDTHAAVDYLLTRPDVDPQRIGMYGQSLGGSIGLNVMADRPEIRAAVVESAFASWRDMAACAVGGEPPSRFGCLLARALISDAHCPAEVIARIDRSLLLIHGVHDSIIPISHSRRLKAAARLEANVRLLELERGDHNSLLESNPEMASEVVAFFNNQIR